MKSIRTYCNLLGGLVSFSATLFRLSVTIFLALMFHTSLFSTFLFSFENFQRLVDNHFLVKVIIKGSFGLEYVNASDAVVSWLSVQTQHRGCEFDSSMRHNKNAEEGNGKPLHTFHLPRKNSDPCL